MSDRRLRSFGRFDSQLRTLVLGLAAVSVVTLATPVAADLAAWDQVRVTELAGQLAAAADGWKLAVREQPGAEVGSGDAEEQFGLVQQAHALSVQASALAKHLVIGKGYDETRNEYRTLKEIIDSTEETAQRAELDDPAMAAWSKLVSLQRQIAPYYDPKADADTDR